MHGLMRVAASKIMMPADESSATIIGYLFVQLYRTFIAGDRMDESSEVKVLVLSASNLAGCSIKRKMPRR